MFFPEKTRQWWLRVWGDGDVSKASCQKTLYSEKNGFYRNCKRDNLYVMEVEIEGMGPVGIPICRHHFMELRGVNIYGPQSSLYPQLAWARVAYKKDKDSFKKIEHSSDTVRTRAGDWGSDEYLINLAKEKASNYILEYPKDKKPKSKAKKHRNWVDIVYDEFCGIEKNEMGSKV